MFNVKKRTLGVLFLLAITCLGVLYWTQKGNNKGDDRQFLQSLLQVENIELDESYRGDNNSWACLYHSDSNNSFICINIYPYKADENTMSKMRSIAKRYFPEKTGEIIKAIEDNIEVVREGAFLNGKIAYSHSSNNGYDISISNWENMGGIVYLNIKIPGGN